MPTQRQLHDWLDEIEEQGRNLTTWEIDFVESMVLQRRAGREFTEKQAAIIERIRADRTP